MDAPLGDLGRLRRVVADAEAVTGVQICVVLVDGDGGVRDRLNEIFTELGVGSPPPVLLVVRPDGEVVFEVSGPAARLDQDVRERIISDLRRSVASGRKVADAVADAVDDLREALGPGRPSLRTVPVADVVVDPLLLD